MFHRLVSWTFVLAMSGLGCGGAKSAGPTGPTAETTTASASDDGEVQASRGATLYAANCASCHGDGGEGSAKSPPVVGKDALPLDPRPTQKYRKEQFHTALDVAQFVVKTMPPGDAAKLKESEYWDILAFDLKANGVDVKGKHIDATSAANIKLH
jgi:cytochrome c